MEAKKEDNSKLQKGENALKNAWEILDDIIKKGMGKVG